MSVQQTCVSLFGNSTVNYRNRDHCSWMDWKENAIDAHRRQEMVTVWEYRYVWRHKYCPKLLNNTLYSRTLERRMSNQRIDGSCRSEIRTAYIF